jgi:uncharacterized membrane protein
MLLIAGSPLIMHVVLMSGEWGLAAYVLILSQTALALWLVPRQLKLPYRQPAALAILFCGVALCVLHRPSGLLLSAGLPHALAYVAMLLAFGTSLLPGRVPVITLLARRVHGSLSAPVERYTRQITAVWVLFAILQLLGSALLLAFAPVTIWSTFVNILNAPLIVALLLGEKLSRSFWVANPPQEHFVDMLRVAAQVKSNLTKRAPGLP